MVFEVIRIRPGGRELKQLRRRTQRRLQKNNTVLHENFAGVLFCGLAFFVVCGNKFLRFEMAEISGGN